MTAVVGMPEAAVNQNDGPVPAENKIRAARQSLLMKTEPKAERVNKRAHYPLGTGVFCFYGCHQLAALKPGKPIHRRYRLFERKPRNGGKHIRVEPPGQLPCRIGQRAAVHASAR